MTWNYLIAAAIMGFTAIVHLFAGELDVHRPLLRLAETPEMQLYVTVLWHFISFYLLASTVVIAIAARSKNWRGAAKFAGIHSFGLAGLFIVVGLIHFQEVFTAPQWILLLPVGVLCLLPERTK